MRIHLARKHQFGAQRSEGVATLAFHPLPSSLELIGPLTVVVVKAISSDVLQRPLDGHIRSTASNHDRQLHLPIYLFRPMRYDHIVVRPRQCRSSLEKKNWLLGNLHSTFQRVLVVVQPDDLRWPCDTRCNALILVYSRTSDATCQ